MKTLKTLTKTTLAIAAASLLFTGCSVDGSSTGYDGATGASGGSSSSSDTMSVTKTGEGFLVAWTKRSGTYGEVIYTDDLDKKRGVSYPLTANADGVYFMPCTMVSSDASGAQYSCKPSNVSYAKSVYLKAGVSYNWLVSTGFDHVHGEVEATTLYSGGDLIVE